MKVIFLDHDGVVCLSNNWGSRSKKKQKFAKNSDENFPPHIRLDDFDKKAVDILNEILEKTDAEIVVSSDWKLHATLEELQEMYREYGVIKSPISVTPRLSDFDDYTSSLYHYRGWLERARCLEIEEWLKRNPVTEWVAVDDLDMSDEYLRPGLKNFVLTPRSTEGIKQSNIKEKIITILNGSK
jgi:hypothetical protein